MEDVLDEAMDYLLDAKMELTIENLLFASQILNRKYKAIAIFNKEYITVDTEVL